jgi:hypothetical protein
MRIRKKKNAKGGYRMDKKKENWNAAVTAARMDVPHVVFCLFVVVVVFCVARCFVWI